MHYVMKYEVYQQYGGPEEGGWWYEEGIAQWRFPIPVPSQSLAYRLCRVLNDREHERRKTECDYEYTSVLSDRDTFYGYGIADTFRPQNYQELKPHYE
jgi:hypothetical protein